MFKLANGITAKVNLEKWFLERFILCPEEPWDKTARHLSV